MKVVGWIIGAGLAAAGLFYVFSNPQGTANIIKSITGGIANYNGSLRGKV